MSDTYNRFIFAENGELNSVENAENEEVIIKLKNWLGKAGIEFFKDIKQTYGEINAVWNEGGIPHAVHFREGMQVRNKLRELIPNMGDHWYDNNWSILIEEAIK